MKQLSLVEDVITTKTLAEMLQTDKKVIIENAKKYLPQKQFEHGKTTYWTKPEVTILIDCMKSNNSNQYREKGAVTGAVTVASTDITPALKLKKAMELAQEAYEEELARLRAENQEKENKLLEQKPKVEFYDDVTGSTDTIDMKEVAKVLHIKGYGRNNLFEFLRNKKVLDRDNQPFQKYVDCGYFRIIESRFILPTGETRINLKTVVFQKGLDYIRKLLKYA